MAPTNRKATTIKGLTPIRIGDKIVVDRTFSVEHSYYKVAFYKNRTGIVVDSYAGSWLIEWTALVKAKGTNNILGHDGMGLCTHRTTHGHGYFIKKTLAAEKLRVDNG